MRMGAIDKHYGLADAAVRAVRAGVDVVLIADDRLPNGTSGAATVVEGLGKALRRGRLPLKQVDEALVRIEAMRSRLP